MTNGYGQDPGSDPGYYPDYGYGPALPPVPYDWPTGGGVGDYSYEPPNGPGPDPLAPPPPAPAAVRPQSPPLGEPEWREYYDPSTGQIWADDGQGHQRYVREANPWERPGGAPGGGQAGQKPTSSLTGAGSQTAAIYNRGPIQDLLTAMNLQYQIWRDKMAGRANEKQTALQAALNFGNQMGYAVSPDFFLRFVHDQQAEAGVPPDTSLVQRKA